MLGLWHRGRTPEAWSGSHPESWNLFLWPRCKSVLSIRAGITQAIGSREKGIIYQVSGGASRQKKELWVTKLCQTPQEDVDPSLPCSALTGS